MMVERALQRRAREAHDWLVGGCFPLWARHGVDGVVFREALELNHRPLEATEVRVRVQGRQAYVFAEAARLGWEPDTARELVHLGLGALTNICRREDGLFGKVIDVQAGKLTDDTPDLYDTAFSLHAMAHAPADTPYPALIGETLAAIDAHMTHDAGGYKELLPSPEYRRQNPHMHLFEACLALHGAAPDGGHMARASAIHALCLKHFIDAKTGTLGEYFMPEDWSRPTGEAGDVVEPGHQFEWVWLLAQYARMAGQALPEQVSGLYRFACSTLDEEGRAVQSCLRDGTLVDASRRTWPQTEALKAHIMMWRLGDDAAGRRAVASFDVLMDEYLTPEGGWIDHYDADGQVATQTMPASTGYHVVLAFLDMINALQA